ncbi:hypothetical protein [Zhihengliuella salsuginis]|uniref:hypothetical protein n=1 Tax=Zhihengliuella salsuginis TaxID=578222 RepID=UPI001678661F|nr:hypothetical protein [Zhihengliuella salsuginis]
MNTAASLRTAFDRARKWLPRAEDQGAPLGEDILLARHGDAVVRLKQNRTLGITVAVLTGGGIDTAPNRLDAVVPAPAPPAARAATLMGDYRAGRTGVDRNEVRLLAKFAAAWTAVTVAVCSATAWFAFETMDPEVLQSMMMAGGAY